MNTPVAPVVIRAMRDRDLAAVVAASGSSDAVAVEFRERYFAGRLDRQRRGVGDILVAWLDGRVVGDVHLIREPALEPEISERLPDVPQISHLEVVPACRRRGIASALLDAVERLAFEHGHTVVCLGVGLDNHGARALYDGRGYDDWGGGTVTFRWDEPGPDGAAVERSETGHVLLKIVDPSIPGFRAWDAWRPGELFAIVGYPGPAPWYVAGGWAIDLHLGRQTRDHDDIEVAIARADLDAWRDRFSRFDLYEVGGGRLRRLDAAGRPENYQIWVCDPAIPAWRMDTFLEDRDAASWVFHRDQRVSVPLREAVARTADGIPYLLPQYVLLAKAKHRRPKDELDLAAALPTMDSTACDWLADALALVHPAHPWIPLLRGDPSG